MHTVNTAEFHKIKQAFARYNDILLAEHKAGTLYREANLKLLAGESTYEILPSIYVIVAELESLWKQVTSFTCFNYYYHLYVAQLQLEGAYPQLLALTTFSDEFLRELKINPKRFDQKHNYLLSINACLRTQELAQGLHLAGEGSALFEAGSDAWLSYKENCFLLAMHSQQYSLANQLLKQVEERIRIDKSSSSVKEKWHLYQAYLDWIWSKSKEATITYLNRHSIKQLMPIYRKDKQGYNISILILQFCHELVENNKEVLFKKAEAYKKYMERHMQREELSRERIFFSLLSIIIRCDFHAEPIKIKSAKLLDQLEQCLLPGGAKVSAIEIVPYQMLWGRMMEEVALLEKTKNNKKNNLRVKS
jgi:hypothetical protein